MNQASIKAQHNFFLVLLIIVGVIIFYICQPFLGPLVIAGSFAVVFRPVYLWMLRRVNNRRNLASLFTVLLVLLVILVPLIIIGSLLFNEAKDLYLSLAASSNSHTSIFEQLVTTIENRLHIIAPDANLDVAGYAQSTLAWVVAHLNGFFSSFLGILIDTFIMIFALFFLFRDGQALKEKIFSLSPLKREYDQNLMKRLISAVNSVIKGSLVVSVVQGLFAAVGFYFAGVPNPVLWGVVAMFASLIPGIGTSLVTVPWIIYLFATQPLIYGLGLSIWAAVGIGMIDNFMAPFVIHRGVKIHQFIVFISVIGGVTFFGPIGFILGPVIFAFFFALLDIYPLIFHYEE